MERLRRFLTMKAARHADVVFAVSSAMIEEMRRRSFTFRTTATRVEKAILGNDAGLYGAAYLPWTAQE